MYYKNFRGNADSTKRKEDKCIKKCHIAVFRYPQSVSRHKPDYNIFDGELYK